MGSSERSPVADPARQRAAAALALLDLARAEPVLEEKDVALLCGRARTPFGPVASVAVPPSRVALARERLAASGARITVSPADARDAQHLAALIHEGVAAGAEEVEIAYPAALLLAGDRDGAKSIVRLARDAARPKGSPRALLKVSLEAGRLRDLVLVRQAADDAITAGADMLATSSLATQPGSRLPAAKAILEAIKTARLNRLWIGFKAAGGIRALAEAQPYMALAERMLGTEFVSPATFRLGGDELLDDLAATLGAERS
jgi:deoxyribose-phosphate aldolase